MEFASIAIAVLSASIALYSAKNSASKNVIDGLTSLINSLETRLNGEIKEREKLEKKQRRYERYIHLLLIQLQEHNIVPVEMPEEE